MDECSCLFQLVLVLSLELDLWVSQNRALVSVPQNLPLLPALPSSTKDHLNYPDLLRHQFGSRLEQNKGHLAQGLAYQPDLQFQLSLYRPTHKDCLWQLPGHPRLAPKNFLGGAVLAESDQEYYFEIR